MIGRRFVLNLSLSLSLILSLVLLLGDTSRSSVAGDETRVRSTHAAAADVAEGCSAT